MRTAISVAVVALLAGCVHVTVLRETPTDERAVRAARAVSFTALAFAFAPPPEWESPDEWREHVGAWTAAYEKEVIEQGARLEGRTLRFLQPGETAPEGVVVTAGVRGIRRGTAMSGDHLLVDAAFLDARTGAKLVTADLDVSSIRGTGGPEGYTFGGRIKFASRNLAEAVVEAVGRGRFQP